MSVHAITRLNLFDHCSVAARIVECNRTDSFLEVGIERLVQRLDGFHPQVSLTERLAVIRTPEQMLIVPT